MSRFSRTTTGRVIAAAPLVWLSACMLITSPGDFSIVDGSTAVTRHDASDGASPRDSSNEAGACSALGGMSPCLTCVEDECCDTYTACSNDVHCFAFLECGVNDTACQSDNMSGSDHANALSTCLADQCTVCSEAGIGDPCGETDGGVGALTCMSGLTCNGTYCTTGCTLDSDCMGSGAGGDNASGGENRCALDESGSLTCFPGCNVASDCADYPGTECVLDAASIVNQATMVCFPDLGDGGIDGDLDGSSDGDAEADAFTPPDAFIEPDAAVPTDAHSTTGSDAGDATVHKEGGAPGDAAGGG